MSWAKDHVYRSVTHRLRQVPSRSPSRYLIAKARLEDRDPGPPLSLFVWGSIFARSAVYTSSRATASKEELLYPRTAEITNKSVEVGVGLKSAPALGSAYF